MNLRIPKEMINENAHCHLNTESLNDKLIVGLMGYSRCGKDTIAREFVSNYNFKRIAFGDALKEEMNKYLKEIVATDLASKYIDLSFERINFLEEKDKLVKEILRPYMIWFGEELRRINGKFYWIHKAFERIGESEKVVITDVRRIDELDLFRNNYFPKNRQAEHLIYAGIFDTEEDVSYNLKYEANLFHINQYKLEERDELTVKAIQKAHEDWLFTDTVYIDSRIPEDKRENYIKTQAFLLHDKYHL